MVSAAKSDLAVPAIMILLLLGLLGSTLGRMLDVARTENKGRTSILLNVKSARVIGLSVNGIHERGLPIPDSCAAATTFPSQPAVHRDTIFSSSSTTIIPTPYGPVLSTVPSMNWQVYHPIYVGGWGWGTVEAPVGNISYLNGEPTGSPDPPSGTAVTYTAISNVGGAKATAIYDITYHDQFEEVSDTKTIVTATGPLFGSGPYAKDNTPDTTLDIPWGPQPAGAQTVVWKGTCSSQGKDLEGGLDARWLHVLGISFDATKTSASGSGATAIATIRFNLPAGEYTYPEFVDTYVRNTVLYRQWGPSGEITVNSTGCDAPATEVFDQYVGRRIIWHKPVPSNTPCPEQDSTSAPVATTPAVGS
jgi:hypothetical protein